MKEYDIGLVAVIIGNAIVLLYYCDGLKHIYFPIPAIAIIKFNLFYKIVLYYNI